MNDSPYNDQSILNELIQLPYCFTPASDATPFGEFFANWAGFAILKLKEKAGALFNELSENAAEQVKANLVKQISTHCAPTLCELLHIARIEGKLLGETPRDRYLYFVCQILSKPDYLRNLFVEFPPFARTISVQIELFIEQFHEFLSRLSLDRSALEKGFGIQGKIKTLDLSLSDPHNRNRSVNKIEFENGIFLIYKPKPLGLDRAYNDFLGKLNDLGLNPKLRTYTVLDQGGYGWVEFIHRQDCRNEEEVKRYFERFGMLISLMYILQGADYHFENMIGAGEYPVLIDLECLFHSIPKTVADRSNGEIDFLLQTGFFTNSDLGEERQYDISPLTADEEQQTVDPVWVWEKVNTDEMQFGLKKVTIRESIPRPRMDGKLIATAPYIDELLHGFRNLWQFISSHKKEAMSLVSPLFRHPIRFILRATRDYFMFLRRLSSPEVMNTEEKVDETFEILTQFSRHKKYEGWHQLVDYEKRALRLLDIPFFNSCPADTHLYAEGKVVGPDFFQRPTMNQVIDSIGQLDETHLQKLLHQMEQLLYFAREKEHKSEELFFPYKEPIAVESLNDLERIQRAEEIGEKILGLADPRPDGTLAWKCIEFNPKIGRHLYRAMSKNLFSGEAGIILFLAALGKPKFVKATLATLDQWKKNYYNDPDVASHQTKMGEFTSLIYTFGAVGHLLKNRELIQDGLQIASLLNKDQIYKDTSFHVVLGSAGLILALLSLYEKCREPSLLKTAEIAGNHLVNESLILDIGCRWGSHDPFGFHYGNSGIAHALFKLGALTRSSIYTEKGIEALSYERNHFPPHRWLLEAPAIGLARLAGTKYYSDPEFKNEIEAAVQSTLSHFVSPIDGLSKGTFGRISFLMALDQQSKPASYQMAHILNEFKKSGTFNLLPLCPRKTQTPSFMEGLSGIGYSLLRSTKEGQKLPEVSLLE